jgi:hypothetical protein
MLLATIKSGRASSISFNACWGRNRLQLKTAMQKAILQGMEVADSLQALDEATTELYLEKCQYL